MRVLRGDCIYILMSNTANTEARSSLYRTPVHAERIEANAQNIDHLAQRADRKALYSTRRYMNLLRCPNVVFASYGARL